jgi:hypothetical protein
MRRVAEVARSSRGTGAGSDVNRVCGLDAPAGGERPASGRVQEHISFISLRTRIYSGILEV